MPTGVRYATQATAAGGRDGRAATADGSLDARLSTRKEFGGAGGEGNNPEQLFAAGYSTCFLGALKFVAGQEKARVPDQSTVTGAVGIGPRSEGGSGLDVALRVSLPRIERAQAEALIQRAHRACPYSNATRGNLDLRLEVA